MKKLNEITEMDMDVRMREVFEDIDYLRMANGDMTVIYHGDKEDELIEVSHPYYELCLEQLKEWINNSYAWEFKEALKAFGYDDYREELDEYIYDEFYRLDIAEQLSYLPNFVYDLDDLLNINIEEGVYAAHDKFYYETEGTIDATFNYPATYLLDSYYDYLTVDINF